MKTARMVLICCFTVSCFLAGLTLAQESEQEERSRQRARMIEPEMFEQRAMELERLIPVWMDSAGVPGLAIAVAMYGKVAGGGAFGVRDEYSNASVDENTVFEAASLSKPVFAFAVLKLVERGKLDLDRPLYKYLVYEDIAADERYKKITARMILSHTSGLPNWRREEQLTIGFEPGAKFSYSGEGFVYLARVVEKITGEPLHVHMRREVLEPLGMWNSSYVWETLFETNFALGHREDGEQIEKEKATEANPAASLHTTAADFARFLAAMQRREGLSEETYEEWLKPQVEVADGVWWGLGWGLQEAEGRRSFWHWGDNEGYKAFVLTYPEEQLGLVLFTNSDNGMSLARPVLAAAMSAQQPGLDWLGYESFNSPARIVRQTLQRVIQEGGVESAVEEYRDLKRHYPAEAFTENLLNSLGYRLMVAEQIRDAIELFKLNVQEYPESFNPYDSLAEAYMKHGEIELAIQNYERSVELNPDNDNGHEMLKKLRKQIE